MNAPGGRYAWTATVGEKGQIVIPKQAKAIKEKEQARYDRLCAEFGM